MNNKTKIIARLKKLGVSFSRSASLEDLQAALRHKLHELGIQKAMAAQAQKEPGVIETYDEGEEIFEEVEDLTAADFKATFRGLLFDEIVRLERLTLALDSRQIELLREERANETESSRGLQDVLAKQALEKIILASLEENREENFTEELQELSAKLSEEDADRILDIVLRGWNTAPASLQQWEANESSEEVA
jgi:hypothetical protein